MFDYHVHTSFSADCNISMKEMIESAIQKGIKEIAFTDHIDYDYPDKSIEFSMDFEKYHSTLEQYYKQYENQIRIVKGLEIGIQKHIVQECIETANAYPYDFIICSVHSAEKQDLHNGDYFISKSPKQAYLDYYTYIYECLTRYEAYNVLGHLNLIDRYTKYLSDHVNYRVYSDLIESILKLIIQKGKGIEVNTSSFKYQMDKLTPTIEMLQLYKDLSGEIITIGSDAHTTNYIGHKYEYICELLKDIGFRYVTTFKNMQPIQVSL